MSVLPKLKVIRFPVGYPREEIMDLEQARYRFSYNDLAAILVEGKPVQSHEELVQLASQDYFKDRELLEVVVISEFVSGG